MKFLDNYQEHIYAAFRIMTGFLFIWHGTQKFFDFPAKFPWGEVNPLLTVAGGIEMIGGLLIMIGFFTRPVAFVASGMMAVAYWMAHGTKDFFPLNNGGELAVIYCFAFLLIASRGAVKWGIDKG
ncbi:MAG: DoxX family protein [Enterobacterales bacterium]|nr:DoxX family protein [Enterobacterales bacterium]